jgi:hypothetical protein
LALVAALSRYAIFVAGGDRPQAVRETRLSQSGEPGAQPAVAALTGRSVPGSVIPYAHDRRFAQRHNPSAQSA